MRRIGYKHVRCGHFEFKLNVILNITSKRLFLASESTSLNLVMAAGFKTCASRPASMGHEADDGRHNWRCVCKDCNGFGTCCISVICRKVSVIARMPAMVV